MSPHKGYMNIAIAAMLFVAAFAGVAFIADEDVAAEGETQESQGQTQGQSQAQAQEYAVTYSFGANGSSIVKTADAEGYITLLTAEDVQTIYAPEGKFLGWKTTEEGTGVVYDFGAKIKLTANLNLYPNVKPLQNEVYFDEEGKDRITESIAADRANQVVPADPVKDGFEFIGWMYSVDGKVYSAADIKNAEKISTLKQEAIFTAQFEKIYDITFIVDGTIISKCASNEFAYTVTENDVKVVKTLQPIDPVKANYTFMGWAVDGKIVSEVKAGVITIPADYKFETGTSFVAVFEPVQLTLTLVVGEFQTTQPALYGQKITAPGLPDGYSHWATMAVVDEKEVYTEFDFSQEIVENMTLYAQKAEKVYTISFISEGAVIGGPYDVSKPYTIPADPVVEGKKFVGWFIGDYKVADIKAYVAEHPDEDIVLTASFTQADAPAGPGFFETNEGKCVAVIIGVALLAFVYAVYTNMFGMKDFLTSIKIQRVKKE